MSPSPKSTPASDAVPLRAYLSVLASTLVLSTTGVLIKFLLVDYELDALALAFLRVLIVSAALGAVLLFFQRGHLRIAARHLPLFALYGFCGVGLHQILWIASVQQNGVGVATVLVYIQPALVALIAWRFMNESLDRRKLLALLLSLSGMMLVSRAYDVLQHDFNLLGLAAGIGTGFTWASYALLGRYTAQRYSAWTSLFYAFLFGTLSLLPLQFTLHPLLPLTLAPAGWLVLAVLALGPTLGGFALYTIGLSQISASITTLLGTLEPVFSIVLAYFLFGEVLDAAQAVGAGMILWSVLMLRPR